MAAVDCPLRTTTSFSFFEPGRQPSIARTATTYFRLGQNLGPDTLKRGFVDGLTSVDQPTDQIALSMAERYAVTLWSSHSLEAATFCFYRARRRT
jgi:hypothetical protein